MFYNQEWRWSLAGKESLYFACNQCAIWSLNINTLYKGAAKNLPIEKKKKIYGISNPIRMAKHYFLSKNNSTTWGCHGEISTTVISSWEYLCDITLHEHGVRLKSIAMEISRNIKTTTYVRNVPSNIKPNLIVTKLYFYSNLRSMDKFLHVTKTKQTNKCTSLSQGNFEFL